MNQGPGWGTELGENEPEGRGFVPARRKTEGKNYAPVPQEVEAVATQVVDAAFKVHKTLGPGLVEAVYEACLCRELALREIPFKSQELVS